MISNNLLDFLRQQIAIGSPQEKIRSLLIAQGWKDEDITAGFAALQGAPTPTIENAHQGTGLRPSKKIFLMGILGIIFLVGAVYALFLYFKDSHPNTALQSLVSSLHSQGDDKPLSINFRWVPIASATDSHYTVSGTSTMSIEDSGIKLSVDGVHISNLQILSYQGATSTLFTKYANDGTHIYIVTNAIESADPATFKVLTYRNATSSFAYAKDATHAYFLGKIIQGADIHSFEALYYIEKSLHQYYAKDTQYVYEGDKIVPSIDPSTVSLVGKYIRDKDLVPDLLNHTIDQATLTYLGESFYKDKNGYYCDADTPIQLKDPEHFKILGPNYGADSESVYSAVDCKPIVHSDPSSFKIYTGYYGNYAVDSHSVYINAAPVQGVDPKTFTAMSSLYFKDSSHVFVYGYNGANILEAADPATFKVLSKESSYATDATKTYYGGAIVQGADARSFTLLNNSYAKDAHNVYFTGDPIIGADVATFVASSTNPWAAQDYRALYSGGVVVKNTTPSLLVLEYVNKLRAGGYSDAAIKEALQGQGVNADTITQALAASPHTSSTQINYSKEMANARDNIETSRAEGYTDSQIKSSMLASGWKQITVDAVFKATPAPSKILDAKNKPTGFSKDLDYVYCDNKNKNTRSSDYVPPRGLLSIKGADPKSFSVILDKDGGGTAVAKDAYSVYEMDSNACESVATADQSASGVSQFGPDASTFEYLGSVPANGFFANEAPHVYYKDSQHIYFMDNAFLVAVVGADVSTFAINTSSDKSYDAQDKLRKYKGIRPAQ